MEQKNQGSSRANDLLRRIFFAIKKSWLLILIVIVVFLAAGAVYCYIRKPNYTASQVTFYKTLPEKAEEGAAGSPATTEQYMETIVDFCNEGCVVDRANFYYGKFQDYLKDKTVKDVKEFIALIKASPVGSDLHYTIDKIDKADANHIKASNIGVQSSTGDDVSFKIVIKYTDPSSSASLNKVQILTTAIEKELNEPKESDPDLSKYFYIKVVFSDFGTAGAPVKDFSTRNIILTFAAVGVVVALATVYIKSLFNRTLTDKEDLERITGADLLAVIDDQEVLG